MERHPLCSCKCCPGFEQHMAYDTILHIKLCNMYNNNRRMIFASLRQHRGTQTKQQLQRPFSKPPCFVQSTVQPVPHFRNLSLCTVQKQKSSLLLLSCIKNILPELQRTMQSGTEHIYLPIPVICKQRIRKKLLRKTSTEPFSHYKASF